MLRIENAARRPDALTQVGAWHWEEWGSADPNGSLPSWIAKLEARANLDQIPLTLLAYEGDRLAGAVSLVEHDMPDRLDLEGMTPWIAGTYVAVERRGQGVGTALMRHAAKEARVLGAERLYLYTATAAAFYERLGWRREFETAYEGETVTVMRLDLASTATGRPS